jgi:uncharacterized protein
MFKLIKTSIFLILGIFLLFNINALITDSQIKLIAVTPDGQGTDANLNIHIKDGSGRIWSAIDSLVGTSTQNTEKVAVELLDNYIKNHERYDYLFEIESEAKLVDGPSAGLPITLALIKMVTNEYLPKYVSGTGTIASNGNIGKVGSVLEKTRYAAEIGIKVFFVPKTELDVVVNEDNEIKKVNLSEYAYSKYNMKVIGVENIKEVLKYNLEDYENIKLSFNTETKEELIYNPPDSKLQTNLEDFKNYIEEYQTETELNLELVSNLLNTTAIKDNDLITQLFGLMSDAKESITLGKGANEKNYLYSAANHLFLANISLNLIKDILENENILNDNKIIDNKTKLLKEIVIDYDGIPCNNYEWYIGSQERYLWAQNKINDILTTPGVDLSVNLLKLRSYEEAKEWLKIAELFKKYSKKDTCYIDDSKYLVSNQDILNELEKAQIVIQKYELYDSEKWYDGALDANLRSWHITSIFESAITLAIVNTHLELKDKNIFEIKDYTENALESINAKDYIWPNLYLQHANYLYNEGKFSEDNNNLENAELAYISAYQLALFSNNLLSVIEDLERNKQNISYTNIMKNNSYLNTQDLYLKIIILFIIIILILGVALGIFYKKTQTKDNLERYLEYLDFRIKKLKMLLIDLENDCRKQKISPEIYEDFSEKCYNEIDVLNSEKENLITNIQHVREINYEINKKHSKIKEIKELYLKDKITHNEYLKKIKEYDITLSKLKKSKNDDIKKISENIL